MVLQSSGAITLGQIRVEFGGSIPDSISEYYKGGANVPNTPANSTIPTSGQIKFSNFYGGSKASNDNTIDAVNWSVVAGEFATNTQTITGINNGQNYVQLKLSLSATPSSTAPDYDPPGSWREQYLQIIVNGTTVATLDGINQQTFNVSNNDVVQFLLTSVRNRWFFDLDFSTWYLGQDTATYAATATITNETDGSVTVDTFSFNV